MNRHDDGAGTVLVLVALLVVSVVAAGCVVVAALGVLRARAGAAADLAALAGAARLADAAADPCDRAGSVAAANRAELTRCVVDAGAATVEVWVEAGGRGLLASAPPARSHAKAGPTRGDLVP